MYQLDKISLNGIEYEHDHDSERKTRIYYRGVETKGSEETSYEYAVGDSCKKTNYYTIFIKDELKAKEAVVLFNKLIYISGILEKDRKYLMNEIIEAVKRRDKRKK